MPDIFEFDVQNQEHQKLLQKYVNMTRLRTRNTLDEAQRRRINYVSTGVYIGDSPRRMQERMPKQIAEGFGETLEALLNFCHENTVKNCQDTIQDEGAFVITPSENLGNQGSNQVDSKAIEAGNRKSNQNVLEIFGVMDEVQNEVEENVSKKEDLESLAKEICSAPNWRKWIYSLQQFVFRKYILIILTPLVALIMAIGVYCFYPDVFIQNPKISSFSVLAPIDPKACYIQSVLLIETQMRSLSDRHTLFDGDCFALELVWNNIGRLYLLTETEQGLQRLHPNKCGDAGYIQGTLEQVRKIYFPESNGVILSELYQLDHKNRTEYIYALAIDTKHISSKQKKWLDFITDCSNKSVDQNPSISMNAFSKMDSESLQQSLDWLRISIQHTHRHEIQ